MHNVLRLQESDDGPQFFLGRGGDGNWVLGVNWLEGDMPNAKMIRLNKTQERDLSIHLLLVETEEMYFGRTS